MSRSTTWIWPRVSGNFGRVFLPPTKQPSRETHGRLSRQMALITATWYRDSTPFFSWRTACGSVRARVERWTGYTSAQGCSHPWLKTWFLRNSVVAKPCCRTATQASGADLRPQKLVQWKRDFSIYDGPPRPEDESWRRVDSARNRVPDQLSALEPLTNILSEWWSSRAWKGFLPFTTLLPPLRVPITVTFSTPTAI